MAYLNTSATDTDDLMNAITTFMAANGYTHIRTQTETLNLVSMQTTTMQCPDNTYVTFISTNTSARPYPSIDGTAGGYYDTPFINEGRINHNADWPSKNAKDGRFIFQLSNYAGDVTLNERPWLGAIRHLTYDVNKDWWEQPDAKAFWLDDDNDGNGFSANMYSAIVAGDDVPNVYIFINTNPDCVHIVTEYKPKHYSHMTIGNLAKSHTYVGGQYIVGSCNCLDSQADYFGYLPLCTGYTRAVVPASLCFGGVYCEGDGGVFYTGETILGMKGWGRVWQTTGIHVARTSAVDVNISTVDGEYDSQVMRSELLGLPTLPAMTHSFIGDNPTGSTFDKVTGQMAPVPLTAWCEHETTGAVYLGSWEHVAVTTMGSLAGKEEIVIGSETYMVFPLSTLKANGTDNMHRDGIDYSGGSVFADMNPYPDAHLFGLGLAIRKVV
ncbi:hypothetical protein ACRXCV_00445 (plasmid) [Halobacteriovorax sp. GFR7]|uniref:hypothetical protein n=1 Tax=unclassified Halobacteriovorax TaxID=2639665 RepID=UPI003D971D42